METLWSDIDSLNKAINPVDWNPFAVDFWHSKNAISEPVVGGMFNILYFKIRY